MAGRRSSAWVHCLGACCLVESGSRLSCAVYERAYEWRPAFQLSTLFALGQILRVKNDVFRAFWLGVKTNKQHVHGLHARIHALVSVRRVDTEA